MAERQGEATGQPGFTIYVVGKVTTLVVAEASVLEQK